VTHESGDMASTFVNLFGRVRTNLTTGGDGSFQRAKTETDLFPKTDPEVDGEECLHDCDSCSVKLPRKWSIDEEIELYGQIKGWHRHMIAATGKSDWVCCPLC